MNRVLSKLKKYQSSQMRNRHYLPMLLVRRFQFHYRRKIQLVHHQKRIEQF